MNPALHGALEGLALGLTISAMFLAWYRGVA